MTIKYTPKLVLLTLFITFLTSCSKEEGIDEVYSSDIQLTYTDIEYEIFNLVNDYRTSNGLTKLIVLNIISKEAVNHTNYMIETGDISHYNFNKRHQNLVTYASAKNVGENIAYGYNSAQGVVNSWVNSDGHREIIENKNYTHFGISTKKNSEGRYYFTNIFIEK